MTCRMTGRLDPVVLSAEQRAEVIEAISRELALEYFLRTNAKREVWARLVIGLPPVPRRKVDFS